MFVVSHQTGNLLIDQIFVPGNLLSGSLRIETNGFILQINHFSAGLSQNLHVTVHHNLESEARLSYLVADSRGHGLHLGPGLRRFYAKFFKHGLIVEKDIAAQEQRHGVALITPRHIHLIQP